MSSHAGAKFEVNISEKFKSSKEKAEESLNIVNNEASKISGVSQDVLIVLGNVASASVFLSLPKKTLGKVFKCLENAKESSERLKSVDLIMPKFALLDYEQAPWYMTFATLTSDTTYCNRKACRMLGLYIDRYRKPSDEKQFRLFQRLNAINNRDTGGKIPRRIFSDSFQSKVLDDMFRALPVEESNALAKDFACQALEMAVKYNVWI